MRRQSRSAGKFLELATVDRPFPNSGGGAEGLKFRRVFRLAVFDQPQMHAPYSANPPSARCICPVENALSSDAR